MLWIGITGPMGSGKSAVGQTLRDLGYDVLDADRVVGEVLTPGGSAEREVVAAFGPAVTRPGGGLDRRALAGAVFSDAGRLGRLEGILHPRVRVEIATKRRELEAAGRAVAFYDVPLLFEKKMESEFDHVLVVSTASEIRLARAMARTGLTQGEVEARWARQLPPEYKESRASAVIRNDGDLKDLETAVKHALTQLHIPAARA